MSEADLKPLAWVGSAYKDLTQFPDAVQKAVGYALYLAQTGDKHRRAKPLSGFGGASALEIVSDSDTDTYRAVYTVRFAERLYVLHAFQKKSRQGISTPPQDIAAVRARLKTAEEMHRTWLSQQTKEGKNQDAR